MTETDPELGHKIKAAQDKASEEQKSRIPYKGRRKPTHSLALAAEFVTGPIIGTLVGWGLDKLAGTLPLFLILFFFLGMAASFWRIYKILDSQTQDETLPAEGAPAPAAEPSESNAAAGDEAGDNDAQKP